jgi:hypothetical protein
MFSSIFGLTGIFLHFHQLGLCFTTVFFRRFLATDTGRCWKNRETDSTHIAPAIMYIERGAAAGSDKNKTEKEKE